jgi:hypothetical protein
MATSVGDDADDTDDAGDTGGTGVDGQKLTVRDDLVDAAHAVDGHVLDQQVIGNEGG